MQAQRKEVAKDAMRDAKLLYQLALAEGRPYQPEELFVTAPEVRESVFSTPEVARELSRAILLTQATTHWVHNPSPDRKAVLASAQAPKAQACESPASTTNRRPNAVGSSQMPVESAKK